MPKRSDLEVFRLLVLFLRSYADMSQIELSSASRVSQPNISLYEKGEREPTEATLRRLAKGAGVEWTLVVQVRRFIEAFLSAASRRQAVSGAEPFDVAVLAPAELAVLPFLIEDQTSPPPRQTAEEDRREAEEIWTALEKYPIPRRRRLIEYTLEASKSAALAMRICEASAQTVESNAREALELAELAFSIAERVEGEESGHVQDHCRERLDSARQAADELAGAG
jgi:transcriptional regulator with XRE-family HTH domain